MRAVLCKAYGPPESLVVEEIAPPEPGQGQLVVDVAACGVNFPDSLIIENKYQLQPPLPFSPGGEVAGTVAAVGEGVSGFAPGDPVIGFVGWGGFAEQVAVDAARVMPVPNGMEMDIAAGFVMTYATSYHALVDRAQAVKGESLLVLGAAGGVGLAAVQLGKVLGLRVIAAASTEEKLEVCRSSGAEETINYTIDDLKSKTKELTGGVDIVFDPVGGDHTEQALRATGFEGRLLVIGFASGPIPRIPLNLPLLKECDIRGVFWGSFVARSPEKNAANLAVLAGLFDGGEISPRISARYPLEEAALALRDLTERRAIGKVILTT